MGGGSAGCEAGPGGHHRRGRSIAQDAVVLPPGGSPALPRAAGRGPSRHPADPPTRTGRNRPRRLADSPPGELGTATPFAQRAPAAGRRYDDRGDEARRSDGRTAGAPGSLSRQLNGVNADRDAGPPHPVTAICGVDR